MTDTAPAQLTLAARKRPAETREMLRAMLAAHRSVRRVAWALAESEACVRRAFGRLGVPVPIATRARGLATAALRDPVGTRARIVATLDTHATVDGARLALRASAPTLRSVALALGVALPVPSPVAA